MQTNKIETTLQKLIDDAVDIVCAEYDEHGLIKTRAVALMNNGERRTIDLTFSGVLLETGTLLADADRAIAAMGAHGRALIVYLLGGEIDLVLISAACGGCEARCFLVVHRKTGKSDNDIVLVTEFVRDLNYKFCLPTEWAGPVTKVEACIA